MDLLLRNIFRLLSCDIIYVMIAYNTYRSAYNNACAIEGLFFGNEKTRAPTVARCTDCSSRVCAVSVALCAPGVLYRPACGAGMMRCGSVQINWALA